jgi:hypothetical protein
MDAEEREEREGMTSEMTDPNYIANYAGVADGEADVDDTFAEEAEEALSGAVSRREEANDIEV